MYWKKKHPKIHLLKRRFLSLFLFTYTYAACTVHTGLKGGALYYYTQKIRTVDRHKGWLILGTIFFSDKDKERFFFFPYFSFRKTIPTCCFCQLLFCCWKKERKIYLAKRGDTAETIITLWKRDLFVRYRLSILFFSSELSKILKMKISTQGWGRGILSNVAWNTYCTIYE